MAQEFIAIDLGAESGRVMLGELSSEGIQLTEIHRFANTPMRIGTPAGERLEWNIEKLWREIRTGLAKIADAHDPASIRGIGVDTWGVDFGLLDGNGKLIGNPVCYRDQRTDGMVDAVFARISKQRVYASTGIQTMAINTLFHLVSMSFSKAAELRAAKHVLFLPDLLSYWLGGVMGTEYTIASTSQMLDAKTRAWSPEICQAVGIDPALFPALQFPARRDSVRGTVLPAANEKLAAARVPVIAVGSHDTASAVAAVPAAPGKDDWLYLSSGTWSLLAREVDEPVLSEKAAAYDVTNEGGVGGKIRLLKNIAGLFLLQECRREWAAAGQSYDYATLTQMAEAALPRLALLDVTDPAFATPGNMPAKIVEHCKRTQQKVPATPGEFTRVILESLADSYAKVRRMLEEITGKTFRTLHIVGGGSQNHLLNQLAADATGMRVLAGPVEATALGNIIAQAISTGALKDIAEGRALVARSTGVSEFVPRQRT